MLKKIEAPNLTEALRRARVAAGPRAVVLRASRLADRGVVVLEVATEPGGDDLERRLARRGVKAARRRRLLEGLLEQPGPLARERALARRLEELMTAPRASLSPGAQETPRCLALVGPTGVGKTTTIAKLAARAQLQRRQRVGLVTLDLYRVAAVDQLRAYAELLGVPLEVASTPDELRSALRRLERCDLVMIDTAGRSPTDARRLAELGSILEAAPEAQAWLVLAATTRLRELRDAVSRFAPCAPSGLVLTKLDEAVVAGDVLELISRCRLPLRLLSAGQEVPDDLEEATPARMASWVLQGTAA